MLRLRLPRAAQHPAARPAPPPGDIVIIRLGDIVPADIKILGEEGSTGKPEDETPLQVGGRAWVGVDGLCCGFCCDLRDGAAQAAWQLRRGG